MIRLRWNRAFSLIEILVVVVILGILAAVMLPKYLSSGKTAGGKTIPSPKQRAQGVACTSYLQQCRQAYMMATSTGDAENRPKSIADLKPYGVTGEISKCPDGGEPYVLDPATGQIHCPHPGHEKL